MRKKETPNPSRVRGRGVEVSETLFYGKVLTCQSKNAAALATDLFIDAAKAALVIRNHLFARRTPHG